MEDKLGCRPFDIKIAEDLNEVLSRVKNKIEQAGGDFSGDLTGGSFGGPTRAGRFEGSYQVKESIITISIARKPFLVSCNTVEARIRSYFSNNQLTLKILSN